MALSRRASSVISGSRAAPSGKKTQPQRNAKTKKTFQPRREADERGYERSATFRSLQLPNTNGFQIFHGAMPPRKVKRRERRTPPPPRPRFFLEISLNRLRLPAGVEEP